MIKTPISLQDLRRRIYVKAKAEPTWRFWGLYVHVCKMETLQEAYQIAKSNDGAPGIDGVTFEAIEESGVETPGGTPPDGVERYAQPRVDRRMRGWMVEQSYNPIITG